MNKKELERRLIDFSVNISEWVMKRPNQASVIHLRDQIIRSSTSAALNYGEAQSAESRKDFIHKISIVMKELRETQINLLIISRIKNNMNDKEVQDLLKENDELLAIFYSTIKTARNKL